MLRISSTSHDSLRANHLQRLTERLARWLRSVSPPAAATEDAALARFVTETIAFADAHGLADEDGLRLLLQLRQRPDFPQQPSPEHRAVLSRPGFSELERIAAFGRMLSATPKLRRVTLDMDFTAERRRNG